MPTKHIRDRFGGTKCAKCAKRWSSQWNETVCPFCGHKASVGGIPKSKQPRGTA